MAVFAHRESASTCLEEETMKRTLWVLMGILIFIPIRTDAQVATRCGDDDKLLPDQVVGRNAWARKCGYIDATRESMLNSISSYQIFSNGCFKYPCAGRNSNCANFVPASAFSPCVAGLIKIGTCYAEALTPARAEVVQACGPPDPHEQAAGETAQGPGLVKWPVELGVCGDFICGVGEDSLTCPEDCGVAEYCGNGGCGLWENEATCPADCQCGDGICSGDESVDRCPMDCGCPAQCGNGVCNNNETPSTCPADCGTLCGDGVCNGGEDAYTCYLDCGSFCGDGICGLGEDRWSCPSDCGRPCVGRICPVPEIPL
ncbi:MULTISPECIES: hypothetical protein [Myxococcus]|uniref:hypothetical protein n=1 Tax=Myxococcus TaxID=32 RepID=UPI001144D779|nr:MULTISPECIES: hypothetical protein [Myxococcus]NOK03639.1 hypothetical protein [Myxococcus xanthus]